MASNDRESKNVAHGVIMILIAIILVLCGAILYDKIFKENTNIKGENTDTKEDISTQDYEMHKIGYLYKNASSSDAVCKTDSKNPYLMGTKYICDNLGDGKNYTFYVLKDATNSGRVDLIMDRDYTTSKYYETENNNSADIGPYNIIKSLPTLSDWPNVETPESSSIYDYSKYSARLPMASEIADACNIKYFNEDNADVYELKSNSSCSFLWLNTQYVNSNISYAGYYTETPVGTNLVWTVDSNDMTQEEWNKSNTNNTKSSVQMYNNVLLDFINGTAKLGVRPVITLSK